MWLPSIISEWKVRRAKKDPFASCLLENGLHSGVRDPEPKREGGKKVTLLLGPISDRNGRVRFHIWGANCNTVLDLVFLPYTA